MPLDAGDMKRCIYDLAGSWYALVVADVGSTARWNLEFGSNQSWLPLSLYLLNVKYMQGYFEVLN